MNKDQNFFINTIIAFIAGIIFGYFETSKFWLLMYILGFVFGINFALYFVRK